MTQELFAGRSWRTEPALTGAMMDAFRQMRDVHSLIEMLSAAAALDLPAAEEARRRSLLGDVISADLSSTELLAKFVRGPAPAAIRRFLRELRPLTAAQTRLRQAVERRHAASGTR